MYLNIPVLVKVVDAGDAAPVVVGVVDVPHIVGAASRVTRHHCLQHDVQSFTSHREDSVQRTRTRNSVHSTSFVPSLHFIVRDVEKNTSMPSRAHPATESILCSHTVIGRSDAQ